VVTTKKKGGKNPTGLSPGNGNAGHSISTALLQSVAEIGTQSTMKISRKTLHEFSPNIPQKTSKGDISRSTNEMLHVDITVRSQSTRVCSTDAREAIKEKRHYHRTAFSYTCPCCTLRSPGESWPPITARLATRNRYVPATTATRKPAAGQCIAEIPREELKMIITKIPLGVFLQVRQRYPHVADARSKNVSETPFFPTRTIHTHTR
jgi:hypothetical protein